MTVREDNGAGTTYRIVGVDEVDPARGQVSWISPIGPLRFEWGIPLDAQEQEDPLVFEFTIGNFF